MFGFSGLLILGMVFSSCTEQHDPTKNREIADKESKIANRTLRTLTDDGKLPKVEEASTEASQTVSAGAKKFAQFCAGCHGTDGSANTPTGQALNPHPRNFTDAKWQESVDDARIAKVIKEGGASVGLSPTMSPWGSMLSDAEVNDIVKMIRGFKK